MRTPRRPGGRWLGTVVPLVAILQLSASLSGHFLSATVGANGPSPVSVGAVPTLSERVGSAGHAAPALQVLGMVPTGLWPWNVAVDTQNGYLAVLALTANLTLVDPATATIVAKVNLTGPGVVASGGSEPNSYALAYDNASNLVYVGGWTGDADFYTEAWSSAVNGSTGAIEATNYTWDGSPLGFADFQYMAADPSTGTVFAADPITDRVDLINGASDWIFGSVPVGSYPDAIAVDPVVGDVYVANRFSDNVTVLDAVNGSFVASISVGTEPDGVLYDPGNGLVYVANNGSANLTVIDPDAAAALGSIAVGSEPGAMAYDSADATIYVANEAGSNLTAVDSRTNSPIGSIEVGSSPSSIVYDPLDQRLYVGGAAGRNLTVLGVPSPPPDYAVAFSEFGLPSGTNWSVELNGTTENSTAETIAFSEPNGTYNYSVPRTGIYSSEEGNGTVEVQGYGALLPIHFDTTARLTFQLVGLPAGDTWTIWIMGPGLEANVTWYSQPELTIAPAFVNQTYFYTLDIPSYPGFGGAGEFVLVPPGGVTVVIDLPAAAQPFPSWNALALFVVSVGAAGTVVAMVIVFGRTPPKSGR